MPVETFTDGIEPEDPNAVIWRFMELWKFEDLMQFAQLYFRRADFLDDETEGLPLKEYEHVLGLNPYDRNDIYERDHHIAFIAQFRESYYINCWYLFEDETSAMWKQYGQNGGRISP